LFLNTERSCPLLELRATDQRLVRRFDCLPLVRSLEDARNFGVTVCAGRCRGVRQREPRGVGRSWQFFSNASRLLPGESRRAAVVTSLACWCWQRRPRRLRWRLWTV